MAEKKKKKGLLERATDYVTDMGVKYLAGRKRMSERLENPTAPPKREMTNLPKPTGTRKPKKKKKPRGGVGGVMDNIQERKKRMAEALED